MSKRHAVNCQSVQMLPVQNKGSDVLSQNETLAFVL